MINLNLLGLEISDDKDARRCQMTTRLLLLSIAWLSLTLVGCSAKPIKLQGDIGASIKTLELVVMESPPLEVIPDLIYSRMPIYAHYENMALPIYPTTELFQPFAGLTITGKVGEEDRVRVVHYSPNNQLQSRDVNWLPNTILAHEASVRLKRAGKVISRNTLVHELPIQMDERTSDITFWQRAIATWYEYKNGVQKERSVHADAIVELAIGNYRVFAGQFSIQLLIKVIDPVSNQVMAKDSIEDISFDASNEQLFAYDGKVFKETLRRKVSTLLANGFQNIGFENN